MVSVLPPPLLVRRCRERLYSSNSAMRIENLMALNTPWRRRVWFPYLVYCGMPSALVVWLHAC